MELGKFPYEIEQHMSVEDLMEINNYTGVLVDEEEQRQKKQNQNVKHKPRR